MSEEETRHEKTLEELASEHDREKWSQAVWLGGGLIYAAALLYGTFRNISLFSGSWATSDYSALGYVAVVLLAANALILPAFIHFRASGWQHLAALVLYVVDICFFAFNAVLDFKLTRGENLSGFIGFYYENVAFATPILVMAGWAVLFVLDPESKLRRTIVEARGEMVSNLSKSLSGAVRRASVQDTVNDKAKAFIDQEAARLLVSNGHKRPVSAVREQPKN